MPRIKQNRTLHVNIGIEEAQRMATLAGEYGFTQSQMYRFAVNEFLSRVEMAAKRTETAPGRVSRPERD